MSTLEIRAVDPLGADALLLLKQAALEARALYPELFGADAPWPTNVPLMPRGVYLVAYACGMPVGCGALRPIDGDTAELRRVYVLPERRRDGVARALLAALESQARALGYRALKLETGHKQQPAMALYQSFGFRRIAPFGPYVDDPTSVCFEKDIG